jgi:hypothetical protein
MNFFKHLASRLTGNTPSQTERGARPSRSPCSASSPNTSSVLPTSEKAPVSNNDTNYPVASPSPEGEGKGEGELKTDSISSSSSNPAGPLAGIASAISRVVHSCSSVVEASKATLSQPHSPNPSDTKTERGAHASRVPCSASPPNTPSASTLKPSNPSTTLSAYERALLEGKTFLEALHIHSTTPTPSSSSSSSNPKPNPLDAFSQPADPPSGYPSLRLINFRPESRWKIWG